jgi:hypothetical protein
VFHDPVAPIATGVSENAATFARPTRGPTPAEPTVAWAAGTHGNATILAAAREADGRWFRAPASRVHSPPAERTGATCRRASVSRRALGGLTRQVFTFTGR